MKSALTRKVSAVVLTLALVIAATFAVPNASNIIAEYGNKEIHGHYGNSNYDTYIYGDVTVGTAAIRLQNLVIDGDLIISNDKVSPRDNNFPGGVDDILYDITLTQTERNETEQMRHNALQDVPKTARMGTVYLTNVRVSGDIIVNGQAPVRMKGSANSVIMNTDGRFTLISGNVGQLYINESAKGCVVTVEKDAVIDIAVLEDSATLRGWGRINKALVPYNYKVDIQAGLVPFP